MDFNKITTNFKRTKKKLKVHYRNDLQYYSRLDFKYALINNVLSHDDPMTSNFCTMFFVFWNTVHLFVFI